MYTDGLTAEGLIRFIANDYVELSHEKIENQRNYYMRACASWLKTHDKWEFEDRELLDANF